MASLSTTETQGSKKKKRRSFDLEPPYMSLRRMVLVGRTGAGKSSTANMVLGKKVFRAGKSASSVTKSCLNKLGEVAGREIILVDTPGLFDSEIPEDYLKSEVNKCLNMTAPGPHAIILVIQLFTEEDRFSVEKIRAIFGQEADKYTIILFTHGDELKSTIEEYISGASENLKKILSHCGGRFHVFNNKEVEDRIQVLELMEKVDEMVAANGSGFYTTDSYSKVELLLKSSEEELNKYYEQQLQEKQSDLESRFDEEKRKIQERSVSPTASDNEQEKNKELEQLDVRHKCRKLEYKRYYEAKLTQVRHEAELTCINDSTVTEIVAKLRRLQL